MANTKATDSTVWVLTYSHRHGDDVSVYDTKEAAYAGAEETIREWLDNERGDDETRRNILALLDAGQVPDAIVAYCEAVEDEGFAFVPTEVYTLA